MRFLPLLVYTAVLAAVQHTWLAGRPGAPDLVCAFLAVVLLAGVPERALLRAWLAGTMRDLADPGSSVFHAVTWLLVTVAYIPCERYLPTGIGGRATLAPTYLLAAVVVDRVVAEGGGMDAWALVLSLVWTAVAAVVIGWLVDGLPEAVKPVASRERRPQTRLTLTL